MCMSVNNQTLPNEDPGKGSEAETCPLSLRKSKRAIVVRNELGERERNMKSERKGEGYDLVVLEVMVNISDFTLSEMSTEVT